MDDNCYGCGCSLFGVGIQLIGVCDAIEPLGVGDQICGAIALEFSTIVVGTADELRKIETNPLS